MDAQCLAISVVGTDLHTRSPGLNSPASSMDRIFMAGELTFFKTFIRVSPQAVSENLEFLRTLLNFYFEFLAVDVR